jgi:tripartite-type tricarboxylate transporter receptor subunit TctC
METVKLTRRGFGVACAAAMVAGASQAQSRPEVARILVPFPPGGTMDMVARLLSEQLRGELADAVVVDNRTGAAGRIAIQALRQAPADGLTLMIHAGGIQTMYPHVLKAPGFDPFADVAPLTLTNRIDTCYAVGPAVPAAVRTLKEYFEWAQLDPRHATYASPGPGTPQHFMPIVLGKQARVELAPVHYRGTTAAFPDVLGGQVPAVCTPLNDAMQQLATGKLRILATMAETRNRLTPEVPTLAELGYPQIVNADWYGAFVHGATPAATQERLSNAIRKALAAPALVAGFRRIYIEPQATTPAETVRMARAAYERNARVVKEVGYEPD